MEKATVNKATPTRLMGVFWKVLLILKDHHSFFYYPNGTLKKETDPFTKSTTYTYDWQRLQSVTDYLSNTSIPPLL